jgi:hypothetical protein
MDVAARSIKVHDRLYIPLVVIEPALKWKALNSPTGHKSR